MKSHDKYPASMRVLHWLMALLILGQIFGGWFMTPYDEAREPLVGQLYWWHKSFGLLAFLLIFIRLSNRLRYLPPELPATFMGWMYAARLRSITLRSSTPSSR